METNNESIILYYKMKRKKHKIKLAVIGSIFIIISLILIAVYCVLNQKHSISYKENSKVRYGINLLKNDFYEEDYVEEGIDIISSLIKNINAEFTYNLDLQEEIEYKYDYKVVLETEIKEKNKTNAIHETKEQLLNKSKSNVKSKKLVISEKIKLDYNKYNDQIKKMIEQYKLTNTVSELHLSLYLDVINKATGEKINSESKVMTLNVPLATKTVEITVNENVKNKESEIILKSGNEEESIYIIILAGIMMIIGGQYEKSRY